MVCLGSYKMEIKFTSAELELSPYQIGNMETLRDFLRSDEIPPPIFDINTYLHLGAVNNLVNYYEIANNLTLLTPEVYATCGTTACAVGHGVLAGIPALPDENWDRYEQRVFGVAKEFSGNRYAAWDFLFGPHWHGLNNTAKGTAARIDYFLKVGVPERVYLLYYRGPSPWFEGLDTSSFGPSGDSL
jgi:hypothetical protein